MATFALKGSHLKAWLFGLCFDEHHYQFAIWANWRVEVPQATGQRHFADLRLLGLQG
jgi:hypothetical protein